MAVTVKPDGLLRNRNKRRIWGVETLYDGIPIPGGYNRGDGVYPNNLQGKRGVCPSRFGLDTIAKMPRWVRHASRLLRVGLRGVDDERDDPFSLKERRQVKITKIGLTRSSSTPSNPYGSKAEA